MATEVFRMHPVITDEGRSPEGGEAPQRGAREAGLTPDRPPVGVGGGDESRSKGPRGFARLDRSRLTEISRRGGKAAHLAGTAHEFTSDEARIAGRKGGSAPHENRRNRLEGRPEVPHRPDGEPRRG
jgi:uncharacterized protein